MTDDDGTFTSGTALDEAFVDQIYDQIDAQVHSATNPTRTPAQTTDEVIAARGSEASLDARLSVALEDDGTLKSQASLVSVANVQAFLGSRNVAINGDLDEWSAGDTSAPDDFTLTTITIEKTGPGESDTFTFGAGRFAAKLTRAATDGTLAQSVIAAADIADYANAKGQDFSVAVKAKTAIANHVRVTIDDGVTTTSSSYHTGGGTEETLTATHTISASATKLDVEIEVNNSAGDAYVGGFVFVFAPFAPSDWQPLSAERDASATRRGLVSTGAQTFAGVKTFGDGAPLFEAGGVTANTARASGRLDTNVTDVGNVTTGEDNLMTYLLPGGSLAENDQVIRVRAWGTFAANANNKRVRGYFGATLIVDSTAQAHNNQKWEAELLIIRTGAATQKASGRVLVNQSATFVSVGTASPAETLANDITIKFTGEATATNDIVQEGLIVEAVG